MNTYSFTTDGSENTWYPMKNFLGECLSKTTMLSAFAQSIENGSNNLKVEFFPTWGNDVVKVPLPMWAQLASKILEAIYFNKSSFWRILAVTSPHLGA